MYLLSCNDRKRIVSKSTDFLFNEMEGSIYLPSIFVELCITVFVACVKRIRSTPYFLLFNVFFALEESI
jgi:hypothetical protein